MKYLILDVETTGVDIGNDRVIELAYQLYDSEADVTISNVQRINPGMPVPDEAIAIHGITNEMLLAEPEFFGIATNVLLEFLRVDVIGGYNVNFDLAMLAAEFARVGMLWPPIGARIIDAYRIWGLQQPRNLANAYKHYCGQADEESFHGAAFDVQCTLDILKAQAACGLSDLTAEYGQILVDPAGKIALDERGEAVFTFGKHMGMPVTENRGYATWMLGADFAESTKQVIRELISGQDLAEKLRAHASKVAA